MSLNSNLLKSITYNSEFVSTTDEFPFNLHIFQNFKSLNLESSVTFLVGENGSGKSTFLEALACKIGSITIGSTGINQDKSLDSVRPIANCLKLSWSKKTNNGFFLRAEDFFGYIKQISSIKAELKSNIESIEKEYEGRSDYAKGLAKMPHAGQLHALENNYEKGLESYSHGESFLELFQARIKPSGLYILDEPEAPLSPFRQLGFISLLKQMVEQGSQFIIATHSPIIMAFPNAEIYSFDVDEIQKVDYENLEHVTLTKSFLQNPQSYLNRL